MRRPRHREVVFAHRRGVGHGGHNTLPAELLGGALRCEAHEALRLLTGQATWERDERCNSGHEHVPTAHALKSSWHTDFLGAGELQGPMVG